MTMANGARELAGRLSPAHVTGVLFTRAGIGRRGYDETEVDVFLDRVHSEISRLIAEKGELRDEVSRLRSQVAGVAGNGRVEEASVQAVRVLADAQLLADQFVADAEHHSRRVASEARQHAEEIVVAARRRAAAVLDDAERLAIRAANTVADVERAAGPGDHHTRQQLEEQIAYLRTFGQVCRTQLRSYLEALLRDVEEEWGQADPAVVTASQRLRVPRAIPPVPKEAPLAQSELHDGRPEGWPATVDAEPGAALPLEAESEPDINSDIRPDIKPDVRPDAMQDIQTDTAASLDPSADRTRQATWTREAGVARNPAESAPVGFSAVRVP